MTSKVPSNSEMFSYPKSKLESSNKQTGGGGQGWWGGALALDNDNHPNTDTAAGQSPKNIINRMYSLPCGDVYSIPTL